MNFFCASLQTGGPGWIVPLGRRDSLGASIQGSNNDIPAPNNTLPTIITKFKLQGLDIVDLVALLGTYNSPGHIGVHLDLFGCMGFPPIYEPTMSHSRNRVFN